MSQIHKAFLGAVALAATLGAVQLAFGHDLSDRWQAVPDKPAHVVNRSGKADRLADFKQAAVPTRTVSMRLNDLAATSVGMHGGPDKKRRQEGKNVRLQECNEQLERSEERRVGKECQ